MSRFFLRASSTAGTICRLTSIEELEKRIPPRDSDLAVLLQVPLGYLQANNLLPSATRWCPLYVSRLHKGRMCICNAYVHEACACACVCMHMHNMHMHMQTCTHMHMHMCMCMCMVHAHGDRCMSRSHSVRLLALTSHSDSSSSSSSYYSWSCSIHLHATQVKLHALSAELPRTRDQSRVLGQLSVAEHREAREC